MDNLKPRIECRAGQLHFSPNWSAPAACQKCGINDSIFENRLMVTWRQNHPDEFYCLQCWEQISSSFDWLGVVCVLIFSKESIRSLAVSRIINKIFGHPFVYLQIIESNILLSDNQFTFEQLTLFQI